MSIKKYEEMLKAIREGQSVKLVLASSNSHKLAEIQQLLGGKFELKLLSDFTSQVPEETGLSFIENAILKARFASEVSGLPALADDSGLMVDCLDGRPGIYSARFAKERSNYAENKDLANNLKLMNFLKGVPKDKRTAVFVCFIVLMSDPKDPFPMFTAGSWNGLILENLVGENGFGYDPLFYVPEYGCSAAELTPEVKNKISHRTKAFEQLRTILGIID